MRLDFSKQFRKQYRKLPARVRDQADERLHLFARSSSHPLLNHHRLHPPYEGCRSINVSGDYRAVYLPVDTDAVLFIAIGTHTELYS